MNAIACLSLVCFAATHAAAQQVSRTDTGTVSLSLAIPQAPIHVALSGDVVLHAWNQPRAEVRVIDEITGRVIGFSNAGTRSRYAVRIASTDAGVLIAPEGRPSSMTIGYSSIRERLRHDVYLPATARVCVDDTNSDLTVDGQFAALDISGVRSQPLKVRGGQPPSTPIADCRALGMAGR